MNNNKYSVYKNVGSLGIIRLHFKIPYLRGIVCGYKHFY